MSRAGRRPPSRAAAVPVPAWVTSAVGGAFLLVYLALAPPVSGGGDTSEFTTVLATLGLAHPTGYPAYTLLGHGFVRLLHACGAGWAWAANAWSALGAALALALWHAFAARLLRREGLGGIQGALLALLPVVALGLDPAWTSEATLAEVTSWHLAWVAGACLYTVATLDGHPARGADGRWVARRWLAWGALAGLGVAHHATSVLVAIPLTVVLGAATRPRLAAVLGGIVAGALVVLAAWSYVFERSLHPAAVQWGSLGPGVRETWNHVTAAGYRHFLGGFHPSPDQRELLRAHVYPWLAPALAAAALWPAARAAAPRGMRLALAAAALLPAAYVFSYGVADPASYFLAPLALGLSVLPAALGALGPVRRWARPLAAAAALGLAVAAWSWTGAAIERRRAFIGLDGFLHSMWRAVPIQRGYVLWDEDLSYRLVQYQQLDHEHPGLIVVRPRLLMDAGARALFAARHGFDPLGGAAPPADADADSPATIERFARQIGDGINLASPDSVILFLPREPALRLLTKPAHGSVR